MYKYPKAHIFMSENSLAKALNDNCEKTKMALSNARAEGRISFKNSGDKVCLILKIEALLGLCPGSGAEFRICCTWRSQDGSSKNWKLYQGTT